MTKRLLFVFPLVLGFLSGYAQLKKANSSFDNYEYYKAIGLYQRIVKKDSNAFALQRLGDCYRLLKDYPHAELVYRAAVKRKGVDPIVLFYYGQALKNNGKITEAREQFAQYVKLVPADKKATVSLKTCDDIKIWVTQPSHFEISNERKLNTRFSEFSPVLYQNKILFTAERDQDLVNFESNPLNNRPYLKVYYSVIADKNGKTTYSNPKLFPGPVNSDYHDGPISIDKNNVLYFTRVSNYAKGANYINRPKILIATPVRGSKSENNWDKPVEFLYDSDDYVVEHPSVSTDGSVLYFTSNMPGGYGGNDIWVSRKNGNQWGKPENLGPEVNTAGNESFPYIRPDGTLFFSSDGLPGFGGLDVFSARFENGKWSAVTNLGLPLNSATDDFGVVFSDDMQKGYFSSDRTGGQGSDDIYSFVVSTKAIDVSGRILLSPQVDDPAKNVKLLLMTEDGSVINFTTSDSMGFFKFENLSPDVKYIVKMDENDPILKFKDKFYLADKENKIVRVTVINERGDRFVFQNLPAQQNAMPLLDEYSNDLKSLSGSIKFGENDQPLTNAKLDLTNESGEIIKTTITNGAGTFVFNGLASDKKLLIRLEESSYLLPPKTKITIYNSAGEVISSVYTSEEGFNFALLPADQNKLKLSPEEVVQLKMSMSGKLLSGAGSNPPLDHVKVNLLNEKGEIVQTVYTDKEGRFKFTQLPSERNFMVKLDDSNPAMSRLSSVWLMDEKGKLTAKIEKEGRTFEYQYLASEKSSLTLLAVDDSQLKFRMKGKIASGEADGQVLANAKVNLLNEKGEIVQTGYTDAQGNFSFEQLPADQNYIISIDEKNPQLASLKRLVIKDESGNTVKEIPAGEKGDFSFEFLASDVKDLALLKVEEPQLLVNMKGKLEPKDNANTNLANKKVALVNEQGEVIDSAKTDANGEFVFKNLPSDRKYMVRMVEEDVGFSDKVKLTLTDSKGKTVQEVQTNEDGSFQYSLLTADRKSFSLNNDGVHMNLDGQFFVSDSLKKEVLSFSKVSIFDQKGTLLQSCVTDRSGRFKFLGLPPDKQFVVKMDEGDVRLRQKGHLILADRNGKTVEEYKRNLKNWGFTLLPADVNKLATEVVDESFNNFKLLGKKLLAKASDSGSQTILKAGVGAQDQPRHISSDHTSSDHTSSDQASSDHTSSDQASSDQFKTLYFDLDKILLSSDARKILKAVATYASENPGTILEIDGHTDSRGGEKYNLYLSDRRAQEVKNYLVFIGVDVNRLIGIAYGRRRPVNSCIEHVECTEAEHALNRRVEIKVIKKGSGLKGPVAKQEKK